MSIQAGQLIRERYELITELGRGGFGVVWLAEDTTLGIRVAIKELRFPAGLSSAEHDEFLVRAQREARNAAQLRDSPHIVTVHDTFETEGTLWIVMELIRGRSLADTIKTHGPLGEDETARIAESLLRALQAAHRAGIIHRDVKPGNVLIRDGGDALLADFGISLNPVDTRLTPANFTPGTPGYIAPELWQGFPPSASSDLYALGVTLYEAIEGAPPHPKDDPVAVLSQSPRPAERAGRLRPLLERLLEKDPFKRPDAGESLAMIGRSVASGDATPATVHFKANWTPEKPLANWVKIHPAAIAMAGVGLVFAIGLMVAGIYVTAAQPSSNEFIGIGGAIGGPIIATVAILGMFIFPGRRLLAAMTPWSLQIDDRGIEAADLSFSLEVPWHSIGQTMIGPIRGGKLAPGESDPRFVLSGLHVRYYKGAKMARSAPVGWPIEFAAPSSRNDGWVPICVLGPLTEADEQKLTAALDEAARSRAHRG